MEAEIAISSLKEDKNVYLSTLEKELEIITCMKKRKILHRENILNNIRELTATADALRVRIQELSLQIDYLIQKYNSMTIKPRVEYNIRVEVEDRVTFKKILKKLDSHNDSEKVGKY